MERYADNWRTEPISQIVAVDVGETGMSSSTQIRRIGRVASNGT